MALGGCPSCLCLLAEKNGVKVGSASGGLVWE